MARAATDEPLDVLGGVVDPERGVEVASGDEIVAGPVLDALQRVQVMQIDDTRAGVL